MDNRYFFLSFDDECFKWSFISVFILIIFSLGFNVAHCQSVKEQFDKRYEYLSEKYFFEGNVSRFLQSNPKDSLSDLDALIFFLEVGDVESLCQYKADKWVAYFDAYCYYFRGEYDSILNDADKYWMHDLVNLYKKKSAYSLAEIVHTQEWKSLDENEKLELVANIYGMDEMLKLCETNLKGVLYCGIYGGVEYQQIIEGGEISYRDRIIGLKVEVLGGVDDISYSFEGFGVKTCRDYYYDCLILKAYLYFMNNEPDKFDYFIFKAIAMDSSRDEIYWVVYSAAIAWCDDKYKDLSEGYWTDNNISMSEWMAEFEFSCS